MERGNLRGVSESVLRSLARALHLNDAETEHLFNLTRAASDGARTPRVKPGSRLPKRAAQLLDAMSGRCSPHLFPDNDAPLNHTRYLFLDARSREFYVEWERDARHVVSVLRLLAGRDPADRALTALVGELATHSPEFRTWWAGHTVKVHTAGRKAIRHPVVGELTVTFETLTLDSSPDIRIVTYLAEPGTASADALDLLRSWHATTSATPTTQTSPTASEEESTAPQNTGR